MFECSLLSNQGWPCHLKPTLRNTSRPDFHPLNNHLTMSWCSNGLSKVWIHWILIGSSFTKCTRFVFHNVIDFSNIYSRMKLSKFLIIQHLRIFILIGGTYMTCLLSRHSKAAITPPHLICSYFLMSQCVPFTLLYFLPFNSLM